ncbi:efflux RND transporter periplasmic adaptor subunit [bacterium]|nr:efflux RND transporter periplasmic adaptor subunit [bacterium]
MKPYLYIKYFGILLLGLAIGRWVLSPNERVHQDSHTNHTAQKSADTYTCSMHPQIQMSEQGQCPICFMDLIPVPSVSNSLKMDSSQLSLSEEAKIMAQIETTRVVRGEAVKEIHLSGKIILDETRTKMITSRISGRIEKLYADFSGMTVRADDHMVSIYSPDLISAREELIHALKYVENNHLTMDFEKKPNAEKRYKSAVYKLSLLGLNDDQIKALSKSENLTSNIDINTPLGGVILEKYVNEGNYIKTGEPLFLISDLSYLWLVLDAYTSDLSLLAEGQKLHFQVDAFPGKKFPGKISFIDPRIDTETRTVKIRAIIENTDLLLKPEMFAKATISVHIGSKNQLIKSELNTEHPLLIPASSVLFTGKRSIVYVELPEKDEPTYEGREIVTGNRVGNNYVVLNGLYEGENLVVKGNFKIDAALQIQAKKSMMNPSGKSHAPDPHNGMNMGDNIQIDHENHNIGM